MTHYDYIIAGGGSAGLGLAFAIARSPLKDKRVLVVDLDNKKKNDRTWCSWVQGATPFDEIAYTSWPKIRFVGGGRDLVIPIEPYRYQMVRGIDFYDFTKRVVAQEGNADFLQARVESVNEDDNAAFITTDEGSFSADYVFDSLFLPKDFVVDETRYHFLKQHFLGWEIKTEKPVFDTSVATLFDFRTPQHGEMRFVYVLPFAEDRGLVEFTLFSHDLLTQEEYTRCLTDYIDEVLRPGPYTIVDSEDGIIPMTDKPFPRAGGNRIMYTGTKGGRVKASTGFAFHRTQADSRAIVQSLVHHGHPFLLPKPAPRYGLFDSMLLQLLYRRGELSERIFTDMFVKNPIDRLFRFLDEEAGVGENIKLMASVPWGPFIQSYFRIRVLGKI